MKWQMAELLHRAALCALSVGTPNSCKEGKAAELLCWTTYIHSAKMIQQLFLSAKGECLLLRQKIYVSYRPLLCSEVPLKMSLSV